MRTTTEWKDDIQEAINTNLQGTGITLSFNQGGVADTITLIMAGCMNFIERMLDFFVRQAFITTASKKYLPYKLADFNISVNIGQKATGEVTFGRYTTGESIFIPKGTAVGTASFFTGALVFKTTQDAILTDLTCIVPIEAEWEGVNYNVEPHTIRYLVEQILGVDYVDNPNATSGGTDGDTELSMREKALNFLQNLTRATNKALIYGAKLVEGIVSVYIKERPIGWEIYREDNWTKVGNWTTIEDNKYHYGSAIKSTQLNDYVEFSFENNGEIFKPRFGGSVDNTLVEIYFDNVLAGTFNTKSSEDIIKPITITTIKGKHKIKIKLIENEMIFDGIEVYSSEPLLGVNDVYIDDGSGTAGWTLMKAVENELENWRACGIQLFIKRCEIQIIDFTLNVKWNTSVNKALTISQITADLSEYLTTIPAGGTIVLGQVQCIALNQLVENRPQIVNVSITNPATDVVLEPDKIARLGELTVYEL